MGKDLAVIPKQPGVMRSIGLKDSISGLMENLVLHAEIVRARAVMSRYREEILEKLGTVVDRLDALSKPVAEARTHYSVKEFAALVGKAEYTVADWCREGRINAEKCSERRGLAEVWKISAQELTRYRAHKLLPRQRTTRTCPPLA